MLWWGGWGWGWHVFLFLCLFCMMRVVLFGGSIAQNNAGKPFRRLLPAVSGCPGEGHRRA